MSKLGLIISREYLTRVKKKTFILITILAPLGFLLLSVVASLLMSSGQEEKTFAVVDKLDILGTRQGQGLKESAYIRFKPLNTSLDSAKSQLSGGELDGVLYIPEQDTQKLANIRIEYYSDNQLGVNTLGYIKETFSAQVRALKMRRAGLDEKTLAALKTSIEITPKSLSPQPEKAEQSSYRVYVATFLGGAMMFLIYFIVFIYGNMVMRSVMEEKTSRIVEVMVSSVKPFTLMLGKIIGVGLVGLTQLAIWAVAFPLLSLLVGLFFGKNLAASAQSQPMATQNMEDIDPDKIGLIMQELASFNYFSLLGYFLIFFLLGYIIYASLFAAVGAALNDDLGEGQSLTLIIALPVMLAFYIGMAAVQNPNGWLAVWASMFPLFAPVVMPARLVFDPPLWQIWVSIFLTGLGALFFVWFSARIYRVGILMYGKKVSFRELAKWIFYKE